jgi:type IV pilus assembly protein PilZ
MSDHPTEVHDDRRVYARAPIELRVEYSRLNAFFADYTKNISKGGTFIRTTQPLDPGTEFVFRLHIPSVAEHLALRGRVVRVVTAAEAAEDPTLDPGMGIRFLYQDEDERERIEAAAEGLMRGSLGETAFRKLVEREKKR